MTPRVTVAIPTFNRPELLRKAVESVLAQTLTEFELYIFDNASERETAAVAEAFDDPRITYVRRPENIGHRANLTAALNAGSAPFVTILHDKEEMMPNNLERKVALLESDSGLAMVHGGFVIVDGEGRPIVPHRRGAPPPDDCIDDSITFLRKTFDGYGGIQHISSVVVRRSAAVDEAFRDEDAPSDDVALWMRIGTRGRVGYLAEPLTLLRAAPGWSTGNSYLTIRNGRFYPTMVYATGGQKIRKEFLAVHGQDLPWRGRVVLHSMQRSWTRRQVISIIRRSAPGLRPWPVARELLREGLRLEPTLLFTPRVVLLFRSYDAVEREMQVAPDHSAQAAPQSVTG